MVVMRDKPRFTFSGYITGCTICVHRDNFLMSDGSTYEKELQCHEIGVGRAVLYIWNTRLSSLPNIPSSQG